MDYLVAGDGQGSREGLNDVSDVTAISLTEVMKAVTISTNQSVLLDNILDTLQIQSFDTSFWEILHDPNVAYNPLVGRDLQKFILNVFYDSITPEALSMIMNCSPDASGNVDCLFSKTLIYVDMP